MRRQIDSIDSELVILHKRRADALDEIIRRFVEIVGIDNRTDVLLLRRHAAAEAPMINR